MFCCCCKESIFLAQRSTFAYSMSYIFWKLLFQRLIWAITKDFLSILQGVRILLTRCNRIVHTIWHYVNCRVRIGHSLSNLRLSCVQPSTSLQNKVAILHLVRQDTTSGHQLVTKWFEETFKNSSVQTNVTHETLSNSWHVIIKLILARICTNNEDRTERKWDIWRFFCLVSVCSYLAYLTIFGIFGCIFGRAQYGQVGCPWKDLAKCSSYALVLGQ